MLARKGIGRTVVAFAVAIAALALPVRADDVIERVVAIVAGDIILLSDLRVAKELGLVPVPETGDTDRAVLSALIDRALMLDEVRRYAPPEPSAGDVDLALEQIRERLTPVALAAALTRAGFTERQLREMLRQNLRIRAYIDQRFGSDTPERARAASDEWLTGLRRRGAIVDLYRAPEPAR
jgi:hypothetical protein